MEEEVEDIKYLCTKPKLSASSRGDSSTSTACYDSPIENYFPRKNRFHECPICFNKFANEFIEEHAQECSATKFDIDIIDIDSECGEDNEDDHTLPYGTDDHENAADEDLTKAESLVNILGPLNVKQKNETSILIKIRRKSVWNDLCAYFQKPWGSAKKNIRVHFVGEPSVDTGGPRRECFTRKL